MSNIFVWLFTLLNILITVFSRTPLQSIILTKKLSQKIRNITIGGIFPMSGSWAGGIGCFPAILRALEDVNMNASVLPYHYLILHSNDSKCEPGLGTNALFDLIRSPPTKLMILGPGCSTVSTFVAEAAKMWNLVVLSYGSSSPALSNRERFPTFFRTHPSAILDNPARIRLIKAFNWTHISIVQQIEEVFTTTAENLETLARENNVSIVTRQNFLTDPVDAVKNLKKHDARIIIGLYYEDMARAVLCAAYKEGLTSPKHVWFLIGWYPNNWYKDDLAISIGNTTNCTIEEMKAAAKGHFTVEPVFLDRFGGQTISGITVKEFEDYIHRSEVSLSDPGYVESPLAYDAVWTMALAINTTINNLQKQNIGIEDFSYNNPFIMKKLKTAMAETKFQGLSSYVAFSATGDRIPKIQIEQLQNDAYVTIGYYDSQKDELLTADSKQSDVSRYRLVKYKFYDKLGLPPKDRKLIHFQFWYISIAIIFVVWFMTLLHSCCCAALIATARAFSEHLMFRGSVHWLNVLILIGCVSTNFGVCIWGLANSSITGGYGGILYLHFGAFLQCIGFTLAVGGMLLKTLMLRRSSPRNHAPKDPVTGKINSPTQQPDVEWYEKVGAMVCITFDVVFHMALYFLDPIKMIVKELTEEERMSAEDSDIFIRPSLFMYECNYTTFWLAVCLGQKGILLLAASFLSFDTRNLKHRWINDSKFISLSVYNIAVFSLITVPLTLLIKDKPTASFSFISGAVLLCTWITLGLISVPKIFVISRQQSSSFGERISFSDNTGRFFGRKGGTKPSSGGEETSEKTKTESESEEAKLKKLMEENEEIKRLISEKENRISDLKDQLLSRLQSQLLHPSQSNEGSVTGIQFTKECSSVEPEIRDRAATTPKNSDLRMRTSSTVIGTERDSLLTNANNTSDHIVRSANTDFSETYL